MLILGGRAKPQLTPSFLVRLLKEGESALPTHISFVNKQPCYTEVIHYVYTLDVAIGEYIGIILNVGKQAWCLSSDC